MKPRIIVSIVLCVVFFWLSWVYFELKWQLPSAHPGLNTSSFAPSEVIAVPDEDDIIVNVYPSVDPSVGIPHPGHDGRDSIETNLNNIKKGWIVAKYNGNCRLLFEIHDADIEDFCPPYKGESQNYYYCEIIPESRLKITDMKARHQDDPADPFTNDERPLYLPCCIAEEIRRYDIKSYVIPRQVIPRYAVVNFIFILIVVGINILINIVKLKSRLKGNDFTSHSDSNS